MMKRIKITTLFILLMMAIGTQTKAQKYEKTLSNNANQAVEIVVTQSDVFIEGYDGDKLIIENLDYDEPPTRAEGLRSLYSSGEDNTGIGLSIEEENGVIKIYPASRDGGEFRFRVPNNVRIKVEEVNWGSSDFSVKNHSGEIELKTNSGDMTLENISGPIVASSTSGDMEISISSLKQGKPSSISLVSGDIDITMPGSSKANLILYTVSGDVFTDLDIDIPQETDMRRLSSGKIEGALNGGGVEMNLKTVSGDIYLRSK